MLDKNLGVLIVEDNLQYASLLTKILQKQCGFLNVVSVPDTDSAYELISTEPDAYNILFIDFHFPQGKTGGQLIDKLKAESFLDKKAAFLITAEPDADNVRQVQAAGVIGVIAKPFEIKQIEKQLLKAERFMALGESDSFSF
jgi:response regulator of citrate/malate metabolism